MAYYSDIVVDDYTKAARAGVSVTVLKSDGTLATLTDNFGAQLLQPLVTNSLGFFSFNATDAVYTLEFRYGGRLVREDEAIVGLPPQFVGPAGPSANVLNALGQSTSSAASQKAVTDALAAKAELTGPFAGNANTASTLANTRTVAATGDITWSVGFNGSTNVSGTATIPAKTVTNAKMADMATGTLKGALAGGQPNDLTASQAKNLLGLDQVANLNQAGILAGLNGTSGAATVGKAGSGTVQTTISMLEGVSVAPAINGTFIGDGSTAKYGVNLNLTGSSASQNEIGFCSTIDNAVTTGGGKAYVVGAFSAATSRAGSATGYGFNSIFRSYGPPGCSNEANTDNFATDSGNLDSQNSIYGAYTWVTGFNVVCAGTAKALAGICISTPPAYPKFLNRGLLIDGDSVAKNGIEDTSSAAVGYKSTGTKGIGIDFTGLTVTSQKAIALGTGHYINWVVGGTPQQVIGVSGTNLQIGYGTSETNFGSSLIPGAPNAFSIGKAGASVSNIFSQNAVTVTSDLREKDVIGNLRDEMDVLAFVRNIRAILYRSKVGQNDPQVISEPGLVIAVDKDGNEIIDQEPVLGDNGEPIMIEVPDWDAMPKRTVTITGKRGKKVKHDKQPMWQPGDPTKMVPQTRGVPRMVPGMVDRTVYVPRAGVRPHAGFGAQHFETELERQAVDCGVFVRKEDGALALRYEQAIPFVWEVCDMLAAQNEALEQRVAVLEAKS